ncbi:hypothetical protein ACWATR_37115 [Nostoc sp. UIC 10890]
MSNFIEKEKSRLVSLLEDSFGILKQIANYTASNISDIVQLTHEQKEMRNFATGLQTAIQYLMADIKKDQGLLWRLDRAVENFYTQNDANRVAIQDLVEISKNNTKAIEDILKIFALKAEMEAGQIRLMNSPFMEAVNTSDIDLSGIDADIEELEDEL